MMRVKKNDTVIVLTGKDKSKVGTVIELSPKEGKVKVSGVAIVTKHLKAKRQGDVAGIKQYESFIDSSNVMPVCRSCKKPCRVKITTSEDGNKSRTCVRCTEIL